MKLAACIFDLDGVVVDTARYHFIAWREIANKLGFDFTEEQNERLKGVSRMDSLEILLEIGGLSLDQKEKEALAKEKNDIYLEYIMKMGADEVLPGCKEFLKELKDAGMAIALGSASKNAKLILEKLDLLDAFDAIIDGTLVTKAKPDPEVFLKGAEALQQDPAECLVFEDAVAGVEAAHRAGMKCIGVGDSENLKEADMVIPGFKELKLVNLKTAVLAD